MDDLSHLLTDPAAWAALATLIAMEIVLGIDNLIFISIITNKLPAAQRTRARRVGIGLALIFRLALLSTIAFIVRLRQPIFSAFDHDFSWRDLILIAGGLFLVWKATREIHQNVDPDAATEGTGERAAMSFTAVVGQVIMLDIVFSLDSIITAVGMTDELAIMVAAVLVAVAAMLFAATPLANFIHGNPTLVMLALGFLLVIGVALIADGFGVHVPKGYIYSAMAFSVLVESLNMLARRARRKRRVRGAAGKIPQD